MDHLFTLFKYLKSQKYDLEAGFIRFASEKYNKKFKKKIEELAKRNTKPFDLWFNGKNRLFFPFTTDTSSEEEVDVEVKDALLLHDYKIVDYIGGYCEKDGVTYRIGKIISKLKDLDLKNALDFTEKEELQIHWNNVNNIFLNSFHRQGKNISPDLLIVISQNPHDIAKMSFERRWTSCMKLDDDDDSNIFCEVSDGGLVAYLINKNDKSIEDPLGRISIRRFANDQGISIAIPEDEVYGINVTGFFEFVKKWCDEKNKINMQKNIDYYNLRGRKVSDSFERAEFFIKNLDNEPFEELKKIFYELSEMKIYNVQILNFDELKDYIYNESNNMKSAADKDFVINILNNKGRISTTNPNETIERIKNLKILDESSPFNVYEEHNSNINSIITDIISLLISKYIQNIDIVLAEKIFEIIKEKAKFAYLNISGSGIAYPVLELIKRFPRFLDSDLFLKLSPDQKISLQEYFGEEIEDELFEYHNNVKREIDKFSSIDLNDISADRTYFSIFTNYVFDGPENKENYKKLYNYIKSYIENSQGVALFVAQNIKNDEIKVPLIKEIIENNKGTWRKDYINLYQIINHLIKDIKRGDIKKEYIAQIKIYLSHLHDNAEDDCSSNKDYVKRKAKILSHQRGPDDGKELLEEINEEKNIEILYRKKYLKKAISFIDNI